MKDDCLSRRPADHLGHELFSVSGATYVELIGDDAPPRSANHQVDLAHLWTVFKLHQEPLCVDRSTRAADSYGYSFHHLVL